MDTQFAHITSTAMFFKLLLQSILALLIVLDPFGLLPLVIGMTRQMDDKHRRRMLDRAVLVGFALMLVFTIGGSTVLKLFGVTADDLRIGGGILLLIIALSVVLSGHMSVNQEMDSGFGIVPIASPLLVGPGSITAAVILVGSEGIFISVLAVIISFFLTWLVLRSTPLIYRVIGKHGSDAVARIMGIFLAAIAVVYIKNGIFGILAVKGICPK